MWFYCFLSFYILHNLFLWPSFGIICIIITKKEFSPQWFTKKKCSKHTRVIFVELMRETENSREQECSVLLTRIELPLCLSHFTFFAHAQSLLFVYLMHKRTTLKMRIGFGTIKCVSGGKRRKEKNERMIRSKNLQWIKYFLTRYFLFTFFSLFFSTIQTLFCISAHVVFVLVSHMILKKLFSSMNKYFFLFFFLLSHMKAR